MYKILALNCLIQAYALSVLYMDGVKLADSQATVAGMLVAICFLFISRSKPVPELSIQRPVSSVFSGEVIFSIIGQFAVHLSSLLIVLQSVGEHVPSPSAATDGEKSTFTPNLVNSAIFILSSAMQITTFAVNYRGHPFMESLVENKGLFYALSFAGGGTVLLALEAFQDFNAYLELVPLAGMVRPILIGVIFADFVLCFVCDRLCRFLFGLWK